MEYYRIAYNILQACPHGITCDNLRLMLNMSKTPVQIMLDRFYDVGLAAKERRYNTPASGGKPTSYSFWWKAVPDVTPEQLIAGQMKKKSGDILPVKVLLHCLHPETPVKAILSP